MSKELPYFKFFVNEWITGDITLEDYEVQGLFINICSYYWSKDCKITLTNVKKKFKSAAPASFEALISAKIMKVDKNDFMTISFLNEQKSSRVKLGLKNSENGKKGGAPKGNANASKTEKQPNASINSTEKQAKTSNIEKRREEKTIPITGIV
ncbi:MAG: hypothetical protein EOO44_22130, partial [Flavobacterium sp.]